jgi:rsbT co-antagonist protein RsbR
MAKEGIHSAVFFPVWLGDEVVGVFEFLGRRVRPLEEDTLQSVNILSAEIGRFLERNRNAELIQEMSTPVLPIGERLLLLPIIGVLDMQRADQLRHKLLRAIHGSRAKAVIVDMTGVAVIDAQVASSLVQTVEAARLLGAKAVLTGLSSAVSRSLAGARADLASITIAVDLRAGITEASRLLAKLGARPNSSNAPPDGQK